MAIYTLSNIWWVQNILRNLITSKSPIPLSAYCINSDGKNLKYWCSCWLLPFFNLTLSKILQPSTFFQCLLEWNDHVHSAATWKLLLIWLRVKSGQLILSFVSVTSLSFYTCFGSKYVNLEKKKEQTLLCMFQYVICYLLSKWMMLSVNKNNVHT